MNEVCLHVASWHWQVLLGKGCSYGSWQLYFLFRFVV